MDKPLKTQDSPVIGDEGSKESSRDGHQRLGRGFGRRKVCPFTADKTIVLDFKNIRVIQRFVSETGRIVPRHVTGVSAKHQRKLSQHIKRARNLGLLAPKTDG
jgi:small subunit ribosomal protein S18